MRNASEDELVALAGAGAGATKINYTTTREEPFGNCGHGLILPTYW